MATCLVKFMTFVVIIDSSRAFTFKTHVEECEVCNLQLICDGQTRVSKTHTLCLGHSCCGLSIVQIICRSKQKHELLCHGSLAISSLYLYSKQADDSNSCSKWQGTDL